MYIKERGELTPARSIQGFNAQISINQHHRGRAYDGLKSLNPLRCNAPLLNNMLQDTLAVDIEAAKTTIKAMAQMANPATHNRFHTCDTCCQFSINIKHIAHNCSLYVTTLQYT